MEKPEVISNMQRAKLLLDEIITGRVKIIYKRNFETWFYALCEAQKNLAIAIKKLENERTDLQ